MKRTFLSRMLMLVALLSLCIACSKSDSGGGRITPTPEPTPTYTITFPSSFDTKPVIAAEGGVVNLQFTASADWTVGATDSGADSWIEISPKSGKAGDANVKITVKPNDSYEERTAVIQIKCGDTVKTITITQPGKTSDVIPVASVSLDKPAITLNEGDNNTLIATVLPSDATDKSVTWSTDNPNIATVDQSGKVTAVAAGEAVITVTTVDGSKTATCTISVNKKLPAGSVTHGEWTGGQGSEAAI